jgi:hypothetical protein
MQTYLAFARPAPPSVQHAFDTLYHAVALELGATSLITADERYYRGASERGSVTLLQNLRLPGTESAHASN